MNETADLKKVTLDVDLLYQFENPNAG